MNAQGINNRQSLDVNADLQQLVQHGRELHDRAVYEALENLVRKTWRFLTASPMAAEVKYSGQEGSLP